MVRSIFWLGLNRWLDKPWKRWTARAVFWVLFLLVVFPYFLSRVITAPPDVSWSGATPTDFHLPYETFTVTSFDGLKISGWYIPSGTQNSELRIQNSLASLASLRGRSGPAKPGGEF